MHLHDSFAEAIHLKYLYMGIKAFQGSTELACALNDHKTWLAEELATLNKPSEKAFKAQVFRDLQRICPEAARVLPKAQIKDGQIEFAPHN
jgi:hypothetical protein